MAAVQVQAEFGVSQPAVSQHLRVLRESGFTSVRPVGARRLYAIDSAPLQEVDDWLDRFRRNWEESYEKLDDVLEGLKENFDICRGIGNDGNRARIAVERIGRRRGLPRPGRL